MVVYSDKSAYSPPPTTTKECKMLNLLTPATNKAVSQFLDRALAAFNQNDAAQLTQSAALALDIAQRTRDEQGQAVASLLLGMAQRDTWLLDSAARSFDRLCNYLDVGVALCARAALEQVRGRCVALLYKALEYIKRAKRRIAQLGDISRWYAVCDVERIIERGIMRRGE